MRSAGDYAVTGMEEVGGFGWGVVVGAGRDPGPFGQSQRGECRHLRLSMVNKQLISTCSRYMNSSNKTLYNDTREAIILC